MEDGATACKPEVVVVEKSCDKVTGVSNLDKWIIALILGAIFLILASPFLFRMSNALFARLGYPTIVNGSPTLTGLIVHALVFALIVRLLMH